MTKKVWKIKAGMGFTELQENIIYDAMGYLESFFDDAKLLDKNNFLKKDHKIIIIITK